MCRDDQVINIRRYWIEAELHKILVKLMVSMCVAFYTLGRCYMQLTKEGKHQWVRKVSISYEINLYCIWQTLLIIALCHKKYHCVFCEYRIYKIQDLDWLLLEVGLHQDFFFFMFIRLRRFFTPHRTFSPNLAFLCHQVYPNVFSIVYLIWLDAYV